MADDEGGSVRMRGNLYARPDYFQTVVTRGVTLTPGGSRSCALSEDFLLGFRDAILYECGSAHHDVLHSAGARWGAQFARRFESELNRHFEEPMRALHPGVVWTALSDAFAYHGWGRLTIDCRHESAGLLVLRIERSMMPELVGESDLPADPMMAGFLASVTTHITRRRWGAVQTDCVTRGANASYFLLTMPDLALEAQEWLSGMECPSHDAILVRILQKLSVFSPETKIDLEPEPG